MYVLHPSSSNLIGQLPLSLTDEEYSRDCSQLGSLVSAHLVLQKSGLLLPTLETLVYTYITVYMYIHVHTYIEYGVAYCVMYVLCCNQNRSCIKIKLTSAVEMV